jgi:hypothetical protein
VIDGVTIDEAAAAGWYNPDGDRGVALVRKPRMIAGTRASHVA